MVRGQRVKNTESAFDLVRELGLKLPDVSEGTMYGAAALKLRGKLLACMATNKSADPESLVVQVGFVNRDLLVLKDPSVYYFRKHYASYPVVLVRLKAVSKNDLREVLEMAHRHMAGAVKRARRRR
jgi:hypothetical protein